MKSISYILAFLFLAFIATPTLVAYLDSSVDVSVAFNLNEEESSSKTQVSYEFNYEHVSSNYESIHFLQEQKNPGHFYTEAYPVIFLDVISPPPKQA